MYYSTKTGKAAIGFKGIARMLGCHPQTVSKQAVNFRLGKELEMYTSQGIRMVNLVMEDELNDLFVAILKSRVKQETKDNILRIQGKYVQAGFRLQVLLEIAPEVVAKEAISHITSTEKAHEVMVSAETQTRYLKEYWGLQDAIQATGASHGAINGHNNKLVGVENGTRNKADDIQKTMLVMLQAVEKLKLEANKDRYKNGHHATNSAKKAGTELAEVLPQIIGS
jgi:hypothetical protein